jgi:hypothetical protein
MLQPLQASGGTLVHLPAAGSPLVDAGSCRGAVHDQRRFGDATTQHRAVDGASANAFDGCDIGAVERDAVAIAQVPIFWTGFELPTLLEWSVSPP